MTGCWARKTSPDQHTCTLYACTCDSPCDLLPTNNIGLCSKHTEELIPDAERNDQAK